MKKAIIFVLLLSMLLSTAVYGEEVEKNEVNDKGVVFFAPFIDPEHPFLSKLTYINQTELFVPWSTIEAEEGQYDWSYFDGVIDMYRSEGKKVNLRVAIGNASPNDTPLWVYNKYKLRRVVEGFWLNFEGDMDEYQLLNAARVIEGETALAESRSLESVGLGDMLMLKEGMMKQASDSRYPLYSVQYDYEALEDSTIRISVISESGNVKEDYSFDYFSGTDGSESFDIPIDKHEDYKVVFALESGKVRMDNVNISDNEDYGNYSFHNNLGLPNIFDDTFKVHYEKFIKAFAEKYNGNEWVNSVAVGGFGRWEEVTLDPNGGHAMEDQWPSHGYEDEAYINHIKWCIDPYEKYFDQTKLSICSFGHGDFRWTNENLVNWEVSTYAASKGVSIKYNGLGETSTEWNNDNTHFAHLFNRYKRNEALWTMYEPGGQFTNDEKMGHPLTVLNRALLDGVDYLWFYGIDAKDPNLYRYFHYFNEQAGTSVVTHFYNHMGEYKLRSSFDYATRTYRNMWNGTFMKNDWYNRLSMDGMGGPDSGRASSGGAVCP